MFSKIQSIQESAADVQYFGLLGGEVMAFVVVDRDEFWHVDSGRARWSCARVHGILQGGDVMVLRDGAVIRLDAGMAELHVRRLILPGGAGGLEGQMGREGQTARILRQSRWAGELDRVLRDCLFEKESGMLGWQSYINSRAGLFRVAFSRVEGPEEERLEMATTWADSRQRVRAFIRQLELEPRCWQQSLGQAAASLKLSVRRFSTLFREVSGTTWVKFQHRKQLERAMMLLRLKPDPVEMISLQSGFMDTKTFHRVFKQHMGITPARWRDQELGINRKAA